MNLTPKQKEVIIAMGNKLDVLRWLGAPSCKFDFMGKTFRYDLGCDLQTKGLIQGRALVRGNTHYQLTELGLSILKELETNLINVK